MSYDYIIANCRIRFDGSESDPQNYGLHNFAPFTAKYDPSAEIVAEIGAALDIDTADTDSTLLMQFAFDNDIAVCKFYRASYGYLFTIDNGRDPIIKFTYDT